MNFVSRSGSRPSTPRIIIFLEPIAPPRACWHERRRLSPAAHDPSRHTNQRRFLKDPVTLNSFCKCRSGFLALLTSFPIHDGWRSRHHHWRRSRGAGTSIVQGVAYTSRLGRGNPKTFTTKDTKVHEGKQLQFF